ncbi:MAG: hypothetical protein JSW20_12685 [Nitrospiraceae bacterium]|nr:MAG: hypothetical protein JSW20_12685 [Nitrospiraceae bacterium]
MTEIGKINKPEADTYKNRKKIYFVRNLYLPKSATDKYKSIYNRYWKEVEEHLTKIEAAGKVSKIFCESLYMSGKEARRVLKSMNAALEKIIQKKIEEGAELAPLEDKDIFGSYVDWNNCMMVIRTQKVYDTIQEHLKSVVKDRFKYIKSVLEKNIGKAEAAMLIMRGEDRELLELPDDIELFLISPPAYDDLQQFLRDRDEGREYWRA